MIPCFQAPVGAAIEHGGSLTRAAKLFPEARQPWIDLSTGINPHSYPLFNLPATAFSRLPEAQRMKELAALAAGTYGAPSGGTVTPAPGTQILLPMVMSLVPPGRAAVLSPTYPEHRRAAALAGHDTREVEDFALLFEADLAVLVNPNNPDGRVVARADLLALGSHLHRKGGLLVVDEAFMDVGPTAESVAGDVEQGGIVVLRSFGKFFGLAGIRLGFAIGAQAVAERLGAQLGPWAVAGPALDYGLRALGDLDWQAGMRKKLEDEARRLDGLLAASAIVVTGGTSLYRFVRHPLAPSLFNALGRHGILTRNFAALPDALRIGLPANQEEFERLARALEDWRGAAPEDRRR